MSYGHLDEDQAACVKRWVEGKTVLDLGAGDLELSQQLLQLGAKKVIAVDKGLRGLGPDPRIEVRQAYFHNLFSDWLRKPEERDLVDIVFCSWPPNYQTNVELVIALFERLIYLGANTSGSACGGEWFWKPLLSREVLDYVPRRRNTLCVYGPNHVDRAPTGEELGALSTEVALRFDWAERMSAHVRSDTTFYEIIRKCARRVKVNGVPGFLGDEILPGRFTVWFDPPSGPRTNAQGEREDPHTHLGSASFPKEEIEWL